LVGDLIPLGRNYLFHLPFIPRFLPSFWFLPRAIRHRSFISFSGITLGVWKVPLKEVGAFLELGFRLIRKTKRFPLGGINFFFNPSPFFTLLLGEPYSSSYRVFGNLLAGFQENLPTKRFLVFGASFFSSLGI